MVCLVADDGHASKPIRRRKPLIDGGPDRRGEPGGVIRHVHAQQQKREDEQGRGDQGHDKSGGGRTVPQPCLGLPEYGPSRHAQRDRKKDGIEEWHQNVNAAYGQHQKQNEPERFLHV